MSSGWARGVLSHRICTGLPRRRLAKLIEELAGAWPAQQESRLRERRGHDRLRAPGAGPDRELVFTDRVITTLVILRFQLPHAAVALFCKVDRSTITRAVHEIRPLLAARGFAVFGKPELRLLLRTGAICPGRMHDVTAVRTAGIEDLLLQHPKVRAEVDSGYQSLDRDFPGQITAPPKKPGPDAPPDEVAEWGQTRKAQSSRRICAGHAIAEPEQWRPLQRYIGRREYFDETMLAIAGLVSDRCAVR